MVSGYTGGTLENPTYEQVSSGRSGHLEAVQIAYDPIKVSYEQLLTVFWRQIDPTDGGGSFVDRGAPSTVPPYLPTMTPRSRRQNNLKPLLRRPAAMTVPLPRKSSLPANFIRQKTITRIITKKIPSGTNFTATVRAGISF